VIDEPTIAIQFSVNNSPFAGREGQICHQPQPAREAGKRAADECFDSRGRHRLAGHVQVLGRGELQLAILIEMMRRESFELLAGRPEIVTKMVDGVRMERSSISPSTCPKHIPA